MTVLAVCILTALILYLMLSRPRKWRVKVIMVTEDGNSGAAILLVSPWRLKKQYFARIALNRSTVEDEDTPFDQKLAERLAEAKELARYTNVSNQ